MVEQIKLICPKCGDVRYGDKQCPYTGHKLGSGWSYVCAVCRTVMEVDKEQEEDELKSTEIKQGGVE